MIYMHLDIRLKKTYENQVERKLVEYEKTHNSNKHIYTILVRMFQSRE